MDPVRVSKPTYKQPEIEDPSWLRHPLAMSPRRPHHLAQPR